VVRHPLVMKIIDAYEAWDTKHAPNPRPERSS
jgi:phosphate starvation-inducible protein PhoH